MRVNLLTTKELAESLSVSEKTIHDWKDNGMPYIRLGQRIIRYDFDKVIKWFKDKNE